MKCVVNAAQFEKMLAQIKPSPIFRGCLLEANGDSLTITHADSRAVTSISIPARVETPGRVSPDITMLRALLKGVGSQDVELSLVDGMHRLRIKFEAGNGTEASISSRILMSTTLRCQLCKTSSSKKLSCSRSSQLTCR